MDVKRIGVFLVSRKLSVAIILIIFGLGFAAGYTISQLIRDPSNSLTIIVTIIAIISSVAGLWKLFSDYRKSLNIPSLEYGKLYSDMNSRLERGGTQNFTLFLLSVRETRGRGQKVNDCEAFMDFPRANIIHRPLYWRNGNRETISIGLMEELQLFTLSSFTGADNVETRQFLFYKYVGIPGHLSYGSEIEYESMDINSEVIISVQVGQGGMAPPKPYKTTIKQILETVPTG